MIQETWFDCLKLPSIFEAREDYSWLSKLPLRVEKIANFGCFLGVEPFRLMWTLDAKEIVVIEIEERNIEEFRKRETSVKQQFPESLQGRKINCVCGDMTSHLHELADQYYELAYCEDVLYTFQNNIKALECGISQMIRVVKPNGFIVAVEPKFGAQYETRMVAGTSMAIPNTANKPKDMSYLFVSKGLKKITIPDCPPHTYCFQIDSV